MNYTFKNEQFVNDVYDRIKTPAGLPASQKQIAKKSQCSQATINRILNGSTPSMKDFLKLCSAMDSYPGQYFNKN